MKIGIIGGGFTGLGAANYLKNHDVTIFESSDKVGGLSSGFKMPEWNWPIDNAIHHWFTTDSEALNLAKEIGMEKNLIIKNTKAACFYKGKIAELDSPLSVLKYPFISIMNRFRLGLIMAYLKIINSWKKLEKETATVFIKKTMGEEVFRIIWEPLFLGKFEKYADKINAAWFWARIHSRTKNLAYIEGGFQTFANELAEKIKKQGAKIILNADVKEVTKKDNKFEVIVNDKKILFDYVLLATPLPVALKLYKEFPKEYLKKYGKLKIIGAQYFVLELEKQFLKDVYWLNINEHGFPFMMIAEHTNFVDKKNYNNKHMIWVGKYLDHDNPLWSMSEEELLEKIIPFLKKINPEFDKTWIKRSFLTRFKYAQPIMIKNYSKLVPSIKTPIPGLYLANMNNVYPWDRGTNYALKIGKEVAIEMEKTINSSKLL